MTIVGRACTLVMLALLPAGVPAQSPATRSVVLLSGDTLSERGDTILMRGPHGYFCQIRRADTVWQVWRGGALPAGSSRWLVTGDSATVVAWTDSTGAAKTVHRTLPLQAFTGYHAVIERQAVTDSVRRRLPER